MLLFLVTAACTLCSFLIVTIPIALFTGFLLRKRTRMIRNVFETGVAVPALITKRRFSSGQWFLGYRYSYGGMTYERGNYIVRFGVKLRRGDQTEVFLNPDKPTQAFLSQFYLAD